MDNKLIIRPMEESDLVSVVIIENASFIDPWSESDLYYELTENPVSYNLVLVYQEQVLGFANYWITFDSATIAQIAIYPPARGIGLASLLLNDVLKRIKLTGEVKTVTLEVREHNISARKLYKKAGFYVSHIKKAYYRNGDNAVYMIKEIDNAANTSN